MTRRGFWQSPWDGNFLWSLFRYCEKFEKIAEVYPSPGYTNEIIYVYRAYPLSVGEASPDDDEFLQAFWLDEAEVKQMIADGKISDAKTLIALQYYFLSERK